MRQNVRMERLTNALELAGERLLAPVKGGVAALRRACRFHPAGLTFLAEVEPAAIAPDLRAVAAHLHGTALVRLSHAAWGVSERDWPGVLRLALRLLDDDHAPQPPSTAGTTRPGDQDLLFSTIHRPWTTPLSAIATHPTSFLWNHYRAPSHFDLEPVGRVKLRLRSPRLAPIGGVSREAHLSEMVAARRAVWTVEIRRMDRPTLRRVWEPLVTVRLTLAAEIDDDALVFSPFANGKGLRPAGLVHSKAA